MPAVTRILRTEGVAHGTRIFEVGCGNGATAAALAGRGLEVTGIDPSVEGIAIAKGEYPRLNLSVASVYDDLRATFGGFPVVVSLEVVEHLYSPRVFAKTIFDLLDAGGLPLYRRRITATGRAWLWPLRGGWTRTSVRCGTMGTSSFWSTRSLQTLLTEAGFAPVRFERIGRVPVFAKSMIAIARKPVPTT